jgi:hypothetical protein
VDATNEKDSLISVGRSAALAVALVASIAACGGPTAHADAGTVADAPVSEPLPPLDGATAGYALAFDGIDDYATAANGSFAPVGSAMSIELWVKYVSGATDQDFFVSRMDFASGVRVGIHAGTVAVRRVYVDRVLAQAPALPSTNAWHHIAYTFDLTSNVLYVDGVQVDAQMLPTDTRTPTSAWLGTIDGTSALFHGMIDEVRVWSVARSAADVQADMKHGVPTGTTGLVAYWTFDDDQPGGRSVDRSGLGNDVTLGDGVEARMPARVPSDAPIAN